LGISYRPALLVGPVLIATPYAVARALGKPRSERATPFRMMLLVLG